MHGDDMFEAGITMNYIAGHAIYVRFSLNVYVHALYRRSYRV